MKIKKSLLNHDYEWIMMRPSSVSILTSE